MDNCIDDADSGGTNCVLDGVAEGVSAAHGEVPRDLDMQIGMERAAVAPRPDAVAAYDAVYAERYPLHFRRLAGHLGVS